MTRFKILHGLRLRATNKLLMPGSLVSTEDEAEIEELRTYVKAGACEESSNQKAAPVEAPAPVDPSEDLSTVDGIGKTLLTKLEAIGITKKSQLVTALSDSANTETLQGILGTKFDKISSQLLPTA
jgi:predicted flap endonuclease-1-like 5' DNA nuclease